MLFHNMPLEFWTAQAASKADLEHVEVVESYHAKDKSG